MKSDIPASVGILTLKNADSIEECISSLAGFADIIVCDGNSTDGTADIARRAGARVIPQYDSDEPDLRCDKDKSAVRQRNMEAAEYEWYFFMDADDTLSPEALDEIRSIVTDAAPKHLIWRMPTRVFIAGKEILHEATYPSYQTRLVHRSVGARFKNPVHDHLIWDEKRYPVGTMRSYYNFHWSAERVSNYWGYLGAYARREIEVAEYTRFTQIVHEVYRRTRTTLGYLLWRLPYMYARYGFKNSMPLSIELTIVRYHLALLTGLPAKYIRTRGWWTLLMETLRGKDLYRTLANIATRDLEAYGRVLDVGGGNGTASYWRFLRRRRWHRVTTLDVVPGSGTDVVMDLDTGNIPRPDGHFDTVLLFNVLEHVADPHCVLSEIARVLTPSGKLVGIVPFLVNVHPDPHDYHRFTEEGLTQALTHAGFTQVRVRSVGTGPCGAAYSHLEFIFPRILKLVLVPIVLGIDGVLCTLRKDLRQKFPLSYRFEASREQFT
ncbi:MAG: methyltransferase domain-containing protein [Bacillota bacterium]